MIDLTTLRENHEQLLARYREAGQRLTSYACPTCEQQIETLVPDSPQIFDTMMTCPFCGDLHFKIVYASGRVRAMLPESDT